MFVAQRADRARRVKRAFAALCLLPTLVLAGVAVWRQSPLPRESFRRQAASALGVGVTVGAVRHLRPGVVAVERMAFLDDAGQAGLELERAELEVTAREFRLRTGAAHVSPAGAAWLVRLARAWLLEPGRFGRDVVIEVGAVVPEGAKEDAEGFAMRAECVAATNGRAVRLSAGNGEGLLVQSFVAGAGEPARYEVSGSWSRDLPVGVVAACLEWTALESLVGPMATISGTITAMRSAGVSRGSFAGVVDGIDLAACGGAGPLVAEGRVRLDVERALFDDGRMVGAAVRVSGGPGAIGRGTLDAVAAALGGRARAAPARPHEARLPYDVLALRAVLGDDGITFEGAAGGAVIIAGGAPLLELPAGPVPVSRLAWALSPASAPAVPATRESAWLLSVLPLPRAAGLPPPAAGPRR